MHDTFSCGKCDERFITEDSLKEHVKEEHTEKEARCIACGKLEKSTLKLNEHIAVEHAQPLPRKVQNFGNYHIEEGNVMFSDEEEDDDYDVSKDTQESDEEDEEESEEEEETGNESEEDQDGEEEVEEEALIKESGAEDDEDDENADLVTLDEEVEITQEDEDDNDDEVENTPKEAAEQEESYPCNECNSVFSYPLPLKLHKKNNHVGKIKCDECNFRTNILRRIEEHERDHHGTIDGEKVTEETSGAMKMVQNLFDFGEKKKRKEKPTKVMRAKQKKAKTDDGRFACEDCDCDYARKDGLKKHRAAKH